MAHRLRATALTILRKPNGKYRPIGAESVWAKLASMVAFDRVVEASRRIFAGVQFGVGGRSSWAIARVRKDFEEKGSVATLDGSNAYNAISRQKVLEALFGSRSCGRRGRWCSCFWAYPAWWLVRWRAPGARWASTRGVRQACAWPAPLFARHHCRRCGACRRSCRTPLLWRTWTT
ncbi:hypothetical protein ERJ75_001286000 [Trypanosoma vivax]|nr:hypothetical protein ERJ75_001286000 [Trypanosoma vivax]